MELKQKYCTLYLVRHGQAQSNVDKIVAGYTDSPLTLIGQGEAQEKAKSLAGVKFDAVFSSDLVRAKRTAEIIAANRGLAVNTTRLLRERNFGEWEGRLEEEFYATNKQLLEKLKRLSEQEKRDAKFGEGYESLNETASRMLVFLREIAATYLGQTVLVVSHGSIMRSLLMHLGYASHDEISVGSIVNTGYIVLESDGVDFFIKKTQGVNKVKI